ncbi:MAG: MBL fold metallo-hydrolase [Candidatus Buchananbacteria bacterium]|nr:MBL fold metallo-hydrolase [Candidatus Buchananbacteria bacterium]
MFINWHGQSCFKLVGDKTTVITDPFDNSIGLRAPRLAGDIVTISHDHGDHNNVEGVKGLNQTEPFIIKGPGEYEYKNVFVYGIASFHDNERGAKRGTNIIYRIEIDGITITHLGDLGHLLENEQLEKIEGTDILLIPVGGDYTIDGKQATKIISELEPRIVIPMHYRLPGLKVKIDGLDTFCKEIGVCPKEELPKFKITKKDLPQEDLQVVLLQP